MTRRAVVSRVIRVRRRYAVQIRPMESVAWAHFRQIFELFVELYRICRYFSSIECVLRIHLVKISLIVIKYELSTKPSKGLAHRRFFWPIRCEKQCFFFINLKNPPRTSEPLGNTHTHLDLWKNTGPSRASLYMTRRAVVSRVIRCRGDMPSVSDPSNR